jgi:hypothetical protein
LTGKARFLALEYGPVARQGNCQTRTLDPDPDGTFQVRRRRFPPPGRQTLRHGWARVAPGRRGIVEAGLPKSFDGDGALFRLVSKFRQVYPSSALSGIGDERVQYSTFLFRHGKIRRLLITVKHRQSLQTRNKSDLIRRYHGEPLD